WTARRVVSRGTVACESVKQESPPLPDLSTELHSSFWVCQSNIIALYYCPATISFNDRIRPACSSLSPRATLYGSRPGTASSSPVVSKMRPESSTRTARGLPFVFWRGSDFRLDCSGSSNDFTRCASISWAERQFFSNSDRFLTVVRRFSP